MAKLAYSKKTARLPECRTKARAKSYKRASLVRTPCAPGGPASQGPAAALATAAGTPAGRHRFAVPMGCFARKLGERARLDLPFFTPHDAATVLARCPSDARALARTLAREFDGEVAYLLTY